YSLPTAEMSGCNSFISCANSSSEICCVLSLRASDGLGCTSIKSASAPIATAPLHMAMTRSARPAPWLGSITIGQCDSCLMIGVVLGKHLSNDRQARLPPRFGQQLQSFLAQSLKFVR